MNRMAAKNKPKNQPNGMCHSNAYIVYIYTIIRTVYELRIARDNIFIWASVICKAIQF